MPILGCGAELAQVLKVSDDDIAEIEQKLEDLMASGVDRAQAQRMAVADTLAEVELERDEVLHAIREQHPEPARAPAARESKPPERDTEQPKSASESLISASEQAKGESSVPEPETPRGIERAQLEQVAGMLRAKGMPKVEIAEGIDGLPEVGKKRIQSEGLQGVRGIYDQATDTVWLVRENITDHEEALFVGLHEAFHRGLRRTLGPQVDAVLDQIYLSNPRVRRAVDAHAQEPGFDRHEVTEEVLADIAGNGTPGDLKGWDRLVALIKSFLDKLGINIQFTDRMIIDLVAGAREAGFAEGVHIDDGADVRMSRAPTQQDLAYEPNYWSAPEATSTDKIIYELQDGRIDLKRVQEAIEKAGGKIEEAFDARLAETLYPGRVAKRADDFLKLEVKPLLQAMARNSVSMDELSDYLIARHAPERNAQIAKVNTELPDGGAGSNSKGELMTTDAAEQYIADLDPARRTLLQMLAKQVDAITAGTRSVLVNEGLEKAETLKAWTGAYKNYVPLFKDEAESFAPHPVGSGFSVKGSASKRATGSTKQVTNVLAHILMQREAAMTRAEKNRVGMSLYGLALSQPNPDFWTTIKPDMSNEQIMAELQRMGVDPLMAGLGMEAKPTITTVDERTDQVVTRTNPMYKSMPNAMVVKVNGDDRVLLFNEADERAMRLASNLKNLDGIGAIDWSTGVLSKALGLIAEGAGASSSTAAKVEEKTKGINLANATRYLAAVNTQYNPAFGLVNVMRDVQGALVNLSSTPLAGQQAKVFKAVPAAFKGIARDLRGDAKRTAWSDLYEQFQKDGAQTGYRDMWRTADERARAIEKEMARSADEGKLTAGNAGRAVLQLLDDFNTSLENAVRLSAYKAALDSGISRARAAQIARELTVDFNRKGVTVQKWGPAYAFLNASLQGTARTIAALKGPAGAKIIAGGLALGVAQALALWAAGFDDDEIQEYDKARSLIIPLGWKNWVRVPLPLGLHVLPNTGRVITELAMSGGKDFGKKSINALGEIASAMNPLGGGDITTLGGAAKTVLPTVADPIIELIDNRNFAGGTISKETYGGDVRPGHQRVKESTARTATGQVYTGISRAINTITGGSEYEKGVASPTPEQVRYLVQLVGGGVYREMFEKPVNSIAAAVGDEPVKASQVPLGGRFYGETDTESVVRSRYFRNKEDIAKAKAAVKSAASADDEAAVERIYAQHPEAALAKLNDKVQRQLGSLNRLAMESIGDLERMREIDAVRLDLMGTLNDAFKELEAEAKVDRAAAVKSAYVAHEEE